MSNKACLVFFIRKTTSLEDIEKPEVYKKSVCGMTLIGDKDRLLRIDYIAKSIEDYDVKYKEYDTLAAANSKLNQFNNLIGSWFNADSKAVEVRIGDIIVHKEGDIDEKSGIVDGVHYDKKYKDTLADNATEYKGKLSEILSTLDTLESE